MISSLHPFADLGLSEPLLRALTEEGYATPTPIQAQAIPSVLAGRDLLGIAQTGTGKTAAFALPILERLARDRKPALRHGCRALILSPTRELANQIGDSFRTYGRHLGFSVAVIFGGMPMPPQTRALNNGVDILVATPGRLLDHMQQHHAKLASTEIFVLDEADQMLDLGFVVPIRRIVKTLAARRQNLFFSATMPKEIGQLAGELLSDPVRVAITPAATTVERVRQEVIFVEARNKRALLVELLRDPAHARTLIFTRTKRGADKVASALDGAGISSAAIHGNKSQSQRMRTLDAFKAGRVRALVATDIAARGIDIDAVSHVINFELPHVPESYVHRIGRTARAGADGIAISFCDNEERGLLRDIERATRQKIAATDRMRDTGLGQAMPESQDSRERPRPDFSERRERPKGKPKARPTGHERRPQDGRSEGRAHEARDHGGGHGKSNAHGKGSGAGKGPGSGKPHGARPQHKPSHGPRDGASIPFLGAPQRKSRPAEAKRAPR